MLAYSIAPFPSPIGCTFIQALLISMIMDIPHMTPGRRYMKDVDGTYNTGDPDAYQECAQCFLRIHCESQIMPPTTSYFD